MTNTQPNERSLQFEELIADETSCDITLEKYGEFTFTVLKEHNTGLEHVVLTSKKQAIAPTLVRIHSSCFTGDIFCSMRCDCHQQLHYSLQTISEQGGILIYLNQEGRGIGLFNKIKAYTLQDNGYDTLEANEQLGLPVDARTFVLAGLVLKRQNISHIRLLTNNPKKVEGLKNCGITDITAINIPSFPNKLNLFYLQTKAEKLQHSISFVHEK